MKIILKIFVLIFILSGLTFANEVKILEFTQSELSKLVVRQVRGADNNTNQTVGSNENGNNLKAIAMNAESVQAKVVKIN